jgi:hypothetical protein
MRHYPLSEEATTEDTTGSFKIPDNFFVDMVIPVHATLNLDPGKFHILQLAVFGSGVNVSIGYDGDIAGTVSVPLASFTRNSVFFIQGVGDFSDVLGKVVIGELDTLLSLSGVYDFTVAGGRIEASVIVPDISGLSGLRIRSGDAFSSLIQGDVAFEAGENVRLDVVTIGGVSVLTINAIDGEGTIADCECDQGIAARPGIKTLNGVQPDENGNIELTGDDCLEVNPSPGDVPAEIQPHTVELTDTCSKPCCGCSELETLVDDQQRVRDEVNTLINVAGRLEAAVAAMQSVVAAC